MKKRFENFTITILKLNKLVHRIKDLEVNEFGLRAIHVMCIYYLKEHKDGLTASELVKLTLEDKAAVSRALALLIDRGYVSRSGPYNTPITLTPQGVEVADAITEKSNRAVAAGGALLTEEQRLTFYEALNLIADSLTEYYKTLSAKNGGK